MRSILGVRNHHLIECEGCCQVIRREIGWMIRMKGDIGWATGQRRIPPVAACDAARIAARAAPAAAINLLALPRAQSILIVALRRGHFPHGLVVEVAVVVVGGTAVASAMGMNVKNDRRETMAYNAYCTYDVKDGRWTMGDGRGMENRSFARRRQANTR